MYFYSAINSLERFMRKTIQKSLGADTRRYAILAGAALSVGLSSGLIDTLINIIHFKPNDFSRIQYLFLNTAATALPLILLCAAFFGLGMIILGRKYKSDGSIITAVSATILLFLTLSIATDDLRFNQLSEGNVRDLILFAALSVAAGIVVLHLASRRTEALEPPVLLRKLTMLTLLILAALLIVWIIIYSPMPLLLELILVLLIAALPVFWWKWLSRIRFAAGQFVPGLLLVVFLAVGAATVPAHNEIKIPDSLSKTLAKNKPPVILITIDALRSDCLSCYNPKASPTKAIDSIAADGVTFMHAITAAPWTLPSFSSIMTGLPVNIHNAYKTDTPLPDTLTTIAERMRQAGYLTTAIIDNPYLGTDYNVLQGFYRFQHFPAWKSIGFSLGSKILKKTFPETFLNIPTSAQLADRAIAFLRNNHTSPLFFWLHFFDPHRPYSPPRKYVDTSRVVPSIGYSFDRIGPIQEGSFVPNEKERVAIRNLYEAEISYVDDQVARIINTLKSLHLYDKSLLIITSDHGEEFWDHGGFEHGHSLFNELIQVPLIIKLPEERQSGLRLYPYISQTRLFNTIMDFSGLPQDSTLHAHSLLPMMRPGADRTWDDHIYSTGLLYGQQQQSMIYDGKKLIQTLMEDSTSLFDLRSDSLEMNNIAGRAPNDVQHIIDFIDEYHELSTWRRTALGLTDQKKITLSKEMKAQLRTLGYIK